MTDQALTTIPEYTATAAALVDLRQKYEAVVYDVTDPKTMLQAKAARAELRGLRVTLEKTRVEIKAPALERCRQIDSEAKRITAELESLENPIDQQIKAEEQRKEREKAEREEADRRQQEEARQWFDAIRAVPLKAQDKTVAQIDALLAEVQTLEYPAHLPAENRDAARYERQLAINGLKAARDRREQADADAAELERLRAEQAARERELQQLRDAEAARQQEAARIERERAEAERLEQARQEAAQAAEERRQREAAEAEQRLRDQEARAAREQQEAVERERARLQREQEERIAAENAERERREANAKHVKKVNKAAVDALVAAGLTRPMAAQTIDVIAAGQIPAVRIEY